MATLHVKLLLLIYCVPNWTRNRLSAWTELILTFRLGANELNILFKTIVVLYIVRRYQIKVQLGRQERKSIIRRFKTMERYSLSLARVSIV